MGDRAYPRSSAAPKTWPRSRMLGPARNGRHVDFDQGRVCGCERYDGTVVAGGRVRRPLKRDLGTRLFLVNPMLDPRARCKESSAPAACGQCAAGPQ